MIKENETQHLNEIGAKIMPKGLLQEYTVRPWHGWRFKVTDGIGDLFSPATDLNHTDMVEQEMVKKGWKISVYSPSEETGQHLCIVSKRGYLISFKAEAPLRQKALAIMRAIGKAVESES